MTVFAAEPDQFVLVTSESKFFRPGKLYRVERWVDGNPRVMNDRGARTWLLNPLTWVLAPRTT